MSPDASLDALIDRIRSGDQQAIVEVMNVHGDAICKAADVYFRRARLERVGDSDDILQMVMMCFLKEAQREDNGWRLASANDLRQLLFKMTESAVADWIQETSRDEPAPGGGEDADLATFCQQHLSPDGQRLYRLRHVEQLDWTEVASLEGATAESCRKKLARELAQVAQKLGLQDKPRADGSRATE